MIKCILTAKTFHAGDVIVKPEEQRKRDRQTERFMTQI